MTKPTSEPKKPLSLKEREVLALEKAVKILALNRQDRLRKEAILRARYARES
jgi:hypothetical protein